MSEDYKGYTLNSAGDPPPWAGIETALFKQLIDNMEERVQIVAGGDNVMVDNTDPAFPVVSARTTSVGLLSAVYMTGDTIDLAEGTFYRSMIENKGSVGEVEQIAIVGDNEVEYFAQDAISDSYTADDTIEPSVYTGEFSVKCSINQAQMRFIVEIYRTDSEGVPIDSGNDDEPIGDLGVKPIITGDTGIVDFKRNLISQVTYSDKLNNVVNVSAGDRIRYHFAVKKVGTLGGDNHISLFFGNSYNTHLDVSAPSSQNFVPNVGSYVDPTTGNSLKEALVEGAIVVQDVGAGDTGFPQDDGQVRTYNGDSWGNTYSVFTSDGATGEKPMYYQFFDYSGNGYGWRELSYQDTIGGGSNVAPSTVGGDANDVSHLYSNCNVNTPDSGHYIVQTINRGGIGDDAVQLAQCYEGVRKGSYWTRVKRTGSWYPWREISLQDTVGGGSNVVGAYITGTSANDLRSLFGWADTDVPVDGESYFIKTYLRDGAPDMINQEALGHESVGGIYTRYSDDGGATWGAWVKIAGTTTTGASGSYTSQEGKTVTVVDGLITSIA